MRESLKSFFCISALTAVLIGCGDTQAPTEYTISGNYGYDILPPEWLLGTWTGVATDGTPKVAMIESDDISFGDLTSEGAQDGITSFATIAFLDPNAEFEVTIDNGTTYEYIIRFNDGESDIEFMDTYQDINGESLEYTFTMFGQVVDTFVFESTPASELIAPPEWLQARWEGLSSDGETDKAAVISASNILFGDIVDGEDDFTDFGATLDFDPDSTFRVLTDDGATFSYVFRANLFGSLIEFTDTYVNNEDGSLGYSVTGAAVDNFTMEDVYYIETPEWLAGMWTGTSTDEESTPKLAIIEANDVSFGDDVAGQPITDFAFFSALDPNARFTVNTDDGSVFSYTIEFTQGDSLVVFTDTYTSTSDTTLDYQFEMGGFVLDAFAMGKAAAADFIAPPEWLQGRWEGLSSDGETQKAAVVTSSNVSFGDIVDGQDDLTDFGGLLGADENSTFKIITNDGTTFQYQFSANLGGSVVTFIDTYTNNLDGTLDYTFEMGGTVIDAFSMTLQIEEEA